MEAIPFTHPGFPPRLPVEGTGILVPNVTVLDLVDVILYILEIFRNPLSRLGRRDVDPFVVVA